MKNEITPKHIERYIKEHRLTQTQFSTLLGTSKFTVNRWLRGASPISPAYQELMKRKLKIVVDKTQRV